MELNQIFTPRKLKLPGSLTKPSDHKTPKPQKEILQNNVDRSSVSICSSSRSSSSSSSGGGGRSKPRKESSEKIRILVKEGDYTSVPPSDLDSQEEKVEGSNLSRKRKVLPGRR